MSTAKIKVVLRKEKLSAKTGEAPVCLRITKERRHQLITLFSIDPIYWDEKKSRVNNKHPNSDVLNLKISSQKASTEQEICMLELNDPSSSVGIDTIRNKINNRTSFDLFEYADKYIEQLYKEEDHASYKKHKTVIKKLRAYVKSDTLPIKSITPSFIKAYEKYLIDEVGNSTNTITVNLKTISKLISDIYRCYNLDETTHPFRNIKLKQERVSKDYLEKEEFKRIRDLKIRAVSPLYDAREIFIFECYTGLRISDILCLKWKNIQEENINIRIRKTKKPFTTYLNKFSKKILDKRRNILERNNIEVDPDRYVFNILKVDVEKVSAQDALNAISSATAIINKQLKRIAQKAKVEKNLSTHVARKTFATLLITQNVNILTVSNLLGHSDVRVTQLYAHSVSQKNKEAMNKLNIL